MAWLGLSLLLVAAGLAVGDRVVRRMQLRIHDTMAHGRWEPIAPGPGHAPLRPVVAALEAEGYVVDSYGLLPLGPRVSPAVALVHPDGSLATVRADRAPIGIVHRRLAVQSILIPGERALGTLAFCTVVIPRRSLHEIAARRPDVPTTVARHRASRRWIRGQGVAIVPVALGGAGPVIEAGMRAVAAERCTESVPALRWRALTGGGRFRVPLSERTEAIPLAAEVRRRQEDLAGARP